MRSSSNRALFALLAAAVLVSLTGCYPRLFTQSRIWGGGHFYSEGSSNATAHNPRMTLHLDPDGIGYAENIPKGNQKWSTNLCVDVDPATAEYYTGAVKWRKLSDFTFEITFAGYTYGVTDGPGKFQADWSEIRIYTCNWGPEYWVLYAPDDRY